MLLLSMTLTGHAWPSGQTGGISHGQKGNVFLGSAVLPADLRRILVLPLTCDSSSGDLTEGCTTLNPIVLAELIKTQKFEVVAANPETVRRLTGQLAWTEAETLPANFFDSLRQEYGCDGVMFCQLTAYHTMPPMKLGWRLELVDARTQQVLWAVDDIFNAPPPPKPVHWYSALLPNFGIFHPSHRGRWLKDNSPRSFAKVTLTTLLSSLPLREEKPKDSLFPADVNLGERASYR